VSLTFTDILCGAGGSSIGLAAAGFELRQAAQWLGEQLRQVLDGGAAR
jgi:site-specific DNA-cytosine methylase